MNDRSRKLEQRESRACDGGSKGRQRKDGCLLVHRVFYPKGVLVVKWAGFLVRYLVFKSVHGFWEYVCHTWPEVCNILINVALAVARLG